MLRALAFLVGAALIVSGLAVWSPALGLVAAGVGVCALAWLTELAAVDREDRP